MLVVVLLIVSCVAIAYFFSLWLLGKSVTGTKQNRKWIAIFPTILFTPLVYFGVMIGYFYIDSYYPSNYFDEAAWHNNKEERYTMSEDLIESELLLGKTREEVIAILGTDYALDTERILLYDLGTVPGGFAFDPDILEVTFENGLVTKVIQFIE